MVSVLIIWVGFGSNKMLVANNNAGYRIPEENSAATMTPVRQA